MIHTWRGINHKASFSAVLTIEVDNVRMAVQNVALVVDPRRAYLDCRAATRSSVSSERKPSVHKLCPVQGIHSPRISHIAVAAGCFKWTTGIA